MLTIVPMSYLIREYLLPGLPLTCGWGQLRKAWNRERKLAKCILVHHTIEKRAKIDHWPLFCAQRTLVTITLHQHVIGKYNLPTFFEVEAGIVLPSRSHYHSLILQQSTPQVCCIRLWSPSSAPAMGCGFSCDPRRDLLQTPQRRDSEERRGRWSKCAWMSGELTMRGFHGWQIWNT